MQLQLRLGEPKRDVCISCIELKKLGQVCNRCGHWALLTEGSYMEDGFVCNHCLNTEFLESKQAQDIINNRKET